MHALPSLNALRAFEAAARHMSFTRAARELAVTQTAVSHQVKLLEEELGVILFRRSPRQIALTSAGRAWAAELGEIFARLEALNRRLRQKVEAARPTVSVSVIPSFGSRWLVPRLGKFLEQHPEIDIRISASEKLVDFASEPIDVGIRYGLGRYPGLAVEKLAEDFWLVVCAPGLLARRNFRAPRDLEQEVLLYDDDRGPWQKWFRLRGARNPKSARYTQLTDSSMLVEAAVRGQGVALARWSLAADELSAGRLATPFPESEPLATGLAYYLACPSENVRRPEVAAFRAFLHRETAVLRSRPASVTLTR
jgi:LysR family transcriptional regulator, glycine cleavage system transcriptional activator